MKNRTYAKCVFSNIKGFTLIELLVVIAIIALLVSILMPSLSKAKELAKTSLCMSNQKSVSSAMYVYASESNDNLPYYSSSSGPDWRRQIGKVVFDDDERYDDVNLSFAPIFECPAKEYTDVSAYNSYTTDNKGFRPGAAINIWVYQYRNQIKITDVTVPGETCFTIDAADHQARSVLPVNLSFGGIGFHHNDTTDGYYFSGNFIRMGGYTVGAFMDGHVNSIRESEFENEYGEAYLEVYENFFGKNMD